MICGEMFPLAEEEAIVYDTVADLPYLCPINVDFSTSVCSEMVSRHINNPMSHRKIEQKRKLQESGFERHTSKDDC